jgi:adenylate kinase family enzyme
MVMGPSGGGKSTIARSLGTSLGLPVFHLDQAFHQSGWLAVPQDKFRAEVERIAALPTWVIDGNYTDTIAPRFRAADTIIYLDVPTRLSMLRIARRIITSHGRVRPDAAPGCPERLNLEFCISPGTGIKFGENGTLLSSKASRGAKSSCGPRPTGAGSSTTPIDPNDEN